MPKIIWTSVSVSENLACGRCARQVHMGAPIAIVGAAFEGEMECWCMKCADALQGLGSNYKALFTAPWRHMPHIQDWRWPCDVIFTEWDWQEHPDITGWICDPTANWSIDASSLDKLPSLKVLVTPSTGTNHIDKAECQRRGIDVLCLLDDPVALQEITASSEFTLLMVLNSLRRIDKFGNLVQHKEEEMRGHEIQGKKVGLIGFGRIGQNLYRYVVALRVGRVLIYDPPKHCGAHPLEYLFSNCDIIVVCCSLNEQTRGMVTGDLVRRMRQGAKLVNTARGEVVAEREVAEALCDRPDLTYCTDVLSGEAIGAHEQSPLIGLPNVLITSHMAGTTVESQEKAAKIALGLLKEWVKSNSKSSKTPGGTSASWWMESG